MRQAWWLLAAPFALLSISSARAADPGADAWVAAEVHGAVLALIGGRWREVRSGDRIGNGIAVRTLQAGSVNLRRGGEEIGLAANTVVRPTAADGQPMVEQYTGVVTLVEAGRTASRAATPNQGPAAGGDGPAPPMLYVRGGEAHLSVGGRHLLLKAGEGYSARGGWEGPIVPEADGVGAATAMAAGAPDDTATTADSAASDGAADNGGGPGNAGQAGSASSPAKPDNGVGNGGTPGNGSAPDDVGTPGNGNGNGGTPGNGGQVGGGPSGAGGQSNNAGGNGNMSGNGNSGKGRT